MSETKEYPACPSCGNAMVYSFAMMCCEYVCLPCYEGVPMFNSEPKLERSVAHMDAKKREWSMELSIIARRFGGARCALCDDASCEICLNTANPDYRFKIWESRVKK